MNQTIIFFAIVIVALVYGLINFVNVLDKDYSPTPMTHPISDISMGEQKELSLKEKKVLWSNSLLKEEVLYAFPNFSSIKDLIETELAEDLAFQELLIKHVQQVEDDYICGTISATKAKEKLSKL